MALDTKLLVEALKQLTVELGGYGAPSRIAKQINVRPHTIARIIKGEAQASLETWELLYNAFPDKIPYPSIKFKDFSREIPYLQQPYQIVLETLIEKIPEVEPVAVIVNNQLFIADKRYKNLVFDSDELYIVEIRGKEKVISPKKSGDKLFLLDIDTNELIVPSEPWDKGTWVKGLVFFTGKIKQTVFTN